MRLHRSLFLMFLLSFLVPICAFAGPEAQYDHVLNSQLSPDLDTFTILADQSDAECWWLAEKFQEWLSEPPYSESLSLVDVGQIATTSGNHIVFGVPVGHPELQLLQAQYKVSLDGLGEEGYGLVSSSYPTEPWRVVGFANSFKGVRGAMIQLLNKVGAPVHGDLASFSIRDVSDGEMRAGQYNAQHICHPSASNAPRDFCEFFDRTTSALDEIIREGANTILLNSLGWVRLDTGLHSSCLDCAPPEITSLTRRSWTKQVTDYCANFGVEVIPILDNNLTADFHNPGKNLEEDEFPMWREGKLIVQEPFFAVPDSDLINVEGNFDNVGENIDWSALDPVIPNWPLDWVNKNENDPNTGTWVFDPGTSTMTLPTSIDPFQQIYTEIAVRGGDYYVMRVEIENASFGQGATPSIFIRFLGHPMPPASQTSTSIRPVSGTAAYDFAFAVPSGVTQAEVGFSSGGTTGVSLSIKSFEIDRRNAGFKNLMMDNAFFVDFDDPGVADDWYPGLDLVLSDGSGNLYIEAVDYEITWNKPQDHKMPFDGPESSVRWLAQGAATTVYATYTLGVPSTELFDSQATTYCFSNGRLIDYWERKIGDLFEESSPGAGDAINPKRLLLTHDEIRGMNRCGRCVRVEESGTVISGGLGQTNSIHLVEHIKTVQGILDYASGPIEAQLVVYSDMLNHQHNGEYEDYQSIRYLGQPGKSSGSLGSVTDPLLIAFWGYERGNGDSISDLARAEGFPQSPHEVLRSVFADEDPEPRMQGDTWYEGDVTGFLAYNAMQPYRTISEDPNLIRALDYAWKRHRNPGVGLQALRPTGEFLGDDRSTAGITIDEGETLSFRPFGSCELRDPGCAHLDESDVTGTIYWGIGSPSDVTSILDDGQINHQFDFPGTWNVTLTVLCADNCDPSDGTQAEQRTVQIPITVTGTPPSGGCKKNCPTQSTRLQGVVPTTTALHLVAPNPMKAGSTIHFSTKNPSEPILEIFDVAGRRVRSERLAHHPAGVWQWSWDGHADDGGSVPIGMYYIRIVSGNETATGKVLKIGS